MDIWIVVHGDEVQIGQFIHAVVTGNNSEMDELWTFAHLVCTDGPIIRIYPSTFKDRFDGIAAEAGVESIITHSIGHLVLVDCHHPEQFRWRQISLMNMALWQPAQKLIGVRLTGDWSIELLQSSGLFSAENPDARGVDMLEYDIWHNPLSARELLFALVGNILEDYESFFGYLPD